MENASHGTEVVTAKQQWVNLERKIITMPRGTECVQLLLVGVFQYLIFFYHEMLAKGRINRKDVLVNQYFELYRREEKIFNLVVSDVFI